MNIENTHISCEVCLDLIPLVRDYVASDDSRRLVEAHIKNCKSCKEEYGNSDMISIHKIDDEKIIKSIKKSVLGIGFILLICGALLGILLSNSMHMFYNFLIMPIVGGLGFLTLNKKWYLVPIGVFVLSYVWIYVQSIVDGMLSYGSYVYVLTTSLFFPTIYTGLVLLGIVIASLLKYSFRKEEK